MNYDLAKRNRLKGKFDFKPRDWRIELDAMEDFPPVPLKNGRPKRPKHAQQSDGDFEGRQPQPQNAS